MRKTLYLCGKWFLHLFHFFLNYITKQYVNLSSRMRNETLLETTACLCMFPSLCANAKIKSHCNLRVCPHLWFGFSAGGMWEYVQLLSPPGLPNNVTVRGGIASVWSHQPTSGSQEELKLAAHTDVISVKWELNSQSHDPHSQHPNTVRERRRSGWIIGGWSVRRMDWLCKRLILMFLNGWCWARSFMAAYICC